MTPWGLVNCKVFGLQGPSLTNRVSELFTHGSVGGVGRKPGPYPADDAIQKVSFYANDHLLGVATNAPYSLVWSNAPAGLYLLRASAVDQSGDHGNSKPVIINVSRFGPRALTQ